MRSASGAGDTAIQLSFLKTVVLLVGNNLPSTLSACNNREQVAHSFASQKLCGSPDIEPVATVNTYSEFTVGSSSGEKPTVRILQPTD
jgi:hypothetical protein